MYLGVRETPTACLRLADIDREAQLICVPSEFNKGMSSGERGAEWNPIPRPLWPYMVAQYEIASATGSQWLFPSGLVHGRKSASGHINPRKLLDWAKQAAAAIGYSNPPVTFHDLHALHINRVNTSRVRYLLDQAFREAADVTHHEGGHSCHRPYLVADVERIRPAVEALDVWYDLTIAEAGGVHDLRTHKRKAE